jgi:MFS transporter, FHS family, glucose/mannose:H+ symporter
MNPESSAANQCAANPSLRQRVPIYPSQFLVAMAIVSLGPLLDPMMRDLAIPLGRAGLISAGLFLGSVSGIVVLNMALARLKAKRTLVGAVALQGTGLILAGLVSWNLWSLFLTYMLVGFGGTLMDATCWMWVSAHMKLDRAGAALRMILFFALAMVSVPLLLGVALDAGASWRWLLVAEGCLALVVAVIVGFLPLLDVCGRQNVRLTQFRQVIAFDPKLLLGLMIAGFTYVGAEMTINIWLPKFQIDVFGGTDTLASLSLTLFWVGMITGRLTMMTLTRRFSPSRLLLALACTLAVFAVAIAIAPTRAVSLVLSVGAGLGASASFGLIGSYAGRFPEWQSTVASSLFILSGGLGSIAFPYIMGPLADAAGFRIALAMVAAPALVYGAASLLIHARADEGRGWRLRRPDTETT